MKEYKFELTEIITHCCDVKTFRFGMEQDIAFKPGQYLILTLNINGRGVSKAFSISNSPTEKGFIQFTKKITQSDFSNELLKLTIGAVYSLRLPMGKFTFEGEIPKAVFLSGGIGITPIRSIFKYATDKRLSSSLYLVYSSRNPEYLIFKDDFIQMQKENKNIKIIYTLTHCDEEIQGCRKGYIDDELIRTEIDDYAQRSFYICGPPGMVDSMKLMLLNKLFIPQENIITEDFAGY